jgi:GNAT superfamily N-acetyltransferase
LIAPVCAEDTQSGFRSGIHTLDDYFARHALSNDRAGVGRCFVLRAGDPGLPVVAGFYTLSMAAVQADVVRPLLRQRLPRYPLPVALIGRLAVDERARGQRFGERLLVDALSRVIDVGESIGCVGVSLMLTCRVPARAILAAVPLGVFGGGRMSRAHLADAYTHGHASCARAISGVFARTEQHVGQFDEGTPS